MKTYKKLFSELDRAALIPFFVIGDPDFDTSLELVKTAIDSGADILELGIPFSDPIADGPTIQKADIRALNSGMNVKKALQFISEIKACKDIPIGLLMYYNLIFQYGIEKFFADSYKAGVNSILIADLNIDDAEEVLEPARRVGLDTVFMVTPNTDTERIKNITSKISGFVYTVSVLGVTGSRDSLSGTVEELVKKLKSITDEPICVGFGISKPEHAAAVTKAGADGVIIGSKIVQIIETNLNNKAEMLRQLGEFIKQIKAAIAKK
ncbi:MAG: tryptophan synthase subunit alpha [Phycisphaerae bacterium]